MRTKGGGYCLMETSASIFGIYRCFSTEFCNTNLGERICTALDVSQIPVNGCCSIKVPHLQYS